MLTNRKNLWPAMRTRHPILIFGGRRGPLPLDETFDADAAAILSLSESTIDAVGGLISTQTGFLATASLRELLVPLVVERAVAASVARYITHLHAVLHEREQSVSEFLEALGQELAERESVRQRHGAVDESGTFNELQRSQLIARSEKLLVEDSAISRYWKARSLAIETGHTLDELSIVCDIRPIFNDAGMPEGRTAIDGMMPLITLRLVVDEGNPLPTPFEVVLNEEQLSMLGNAVDTAKKRIAAMYATLAASKIPYPEAWNSQVDDDEEEGT